MFEDYYHSELAYLRSLAHEFSRSFPEVAHMVSERRGDRSVERVMQGAALLAARLRYRLDDDFPEIIHALFDSMWPQYLRPVPCLSLLQFTPLPNVLRQTQVIPSGTSVTSRPADDVECTFQTCAAVELHPLQVASATVTRPHPADLQVRVCLEMSGGVTFDTVKMKRLRLHLLGDRLTRFTLYLWLTHFNNRISVYDGEGKTVLTLPGAAIVPVGFADDDYLCPYHPSMLPGVRTLQEHFSFPDKFLAVELSGLDQIPLGVLESSFELAFHLGTPPDANLRISEENFALGCTPVVNLSRSEQVDVQVVKGATEYRLEAPEEGEIFSVDGVGAYDSRSGDWIEYPPLFTRTRTRLLDKNPRYQILRRSDGIRGVETYLAIRDAEGNPLEPPAELLNVHLSYTNGNKPLRLGIGEIDVPTSSTPQFVKFSNLVPITVPSALAVDKDRHWELLSLFAMHSLDLQSVNGLDQLIRKCHVPGSSIQVRPRVLEVRTSVSSRLHRQTVVPVTLVAIDLDDEAFVGPGEMYLLGRVLSNLLMDRPDITSFTEVTVRGVPSGTEFHYK